MKLQDIDLIELNEALQPPLPWWKKTEHWQKRNWMKTEVLLRQATARVIQSVYRFNCLMNQRQNKKYGMVTVCVGGGQGVAGILAKCYKA